MDDVSSLRSEMKSFALLINEDSGKIRLMK